MSELPFMTVFQVLSPLEPCYDVMNGNSLICWTPALSRYITAQLMC